MARKQPSFEDRLLELEALVRKMEEGSMPLNETLSAYEEGMKLTNELNQKLEAAGNRMMEVRLGRDGEPKVEECDVAQQQSLLDVIVDD